MADVSNRDDIIDIRDAIERYEELEEELGDIFVTEKEKERDELQDALNLVESPESEVYASETKRLNHLNDLLEDHGPADLLKWMEKIRDEIGADHLYHEEVMEFFQLKDLLDSVAGYGGDHQWKGYWYPITLVRDSHFEDHARELAEEIGAINPNASWPNNCIDWKFAARELQMDYSSVEFDDVTYWYRG